MHREEETAGPPVAISLDFMPAFYHKHLGLRFGEAYYFDPGHRERVESAKGRFLYDLLGRYGVGSSAPPTTHDIFIQSIDLTLRTQGAEWRFPVDAAVESWGTPWAAFTPEESAAFDAAKPRITR